MDHNDHNESLRPPLSSYLDKGAQQGRAPGLLVDLDVLKAGQPVQHHGLVDGRSVGWLVCVGLYGLDGCFGRCRENMQCGDPRPLLMQAAGLASALKARHRRTPRASHSS